YSPHPKTGTTRTGLVTQHRALGIEATNPLIELLVLNISREDYNAHENFDLRGACHSRDVRSRRCPATPSGDPANRSHQTHSIAKTRRTRDQLRNGGRDR